MKITTENIAEFEAISDVLNKLPIKVAQQIEYAEKKISYIHCKIKKSHSEVVKIYLPTDVNTIEVSGKGFCAFNSKIRFELVKSESQILTFNIIK